jgi:hypothetical protein
MSLKEDVHTYLSTYKSVRYNIFVGILGYIHKIITLIIIFTGLCYIYHSNLFLTQQHIDGEVIIYPSYYEKQSNFTVCKPYEVSTNCSKYMNTFSKNITCSNKISLEEFFPDGHSRTHIEMTTSILDYNKNQMIAGAENNNIVFKIWFYDDYRNVTLTFIDKNDKTVGILYQTSNNNFVTNTSFLLKVLNIKSIDEINQNSYNNCSYRINGITMIVNINCHNSWPNDLQCYAKVYIVSMHETQLHYAKTIVNNIIHYKRYFGIKVMFDRITGIYYHITLLSLLLMSALLLKFLEYVYIAIHIIIKYFLIMYTTYYNRKHRVEVYDGIYAYHINSMLNQLSDEYTTHHVNEKINSDEYDNIKDLEI